MEDFSNEPKKERHEVVKATFKVVFKRYFLVPCLLYVVNVIGSVMIAIIPDLIEGDNDYNKIWLYTIFINITCGVVFILMIIIIGVLIVLALSELISYLKKRTLVKDLKECLHDIEKGFIFLIKGIIKLPKRIYNRLKKEPKLIREAIKEQLDKQAQKRIP